MVTGVARVYNTLQLCIDRLGPKSELHQGIQCFILLPLKVALLVAMLATVSRIVSCLNLKVLQLYQ